MHAIVRIVTWNCWINVLYFYHILYYTAQQIFMKVLFHFIVMFLYAVWHSENENNIWCYTKTLLFVQHQTFSWKLKNKKNWKIKKLKMYRNVILSEFFVMPDNTYTVTVELHYSRITCYMYGQKLQKCTVSVIASTFLIASSHLPW